MSPRASPPLPFPTLLDTASSAAVDGKQTTSDIGACMLMFAAGTIPVTTREATM